MDIKIAELIEKFQEGNNNCLVELLGFFHPLLNKYERLLSDEDAYQNLKVSLITSFSHLHINELVGKQDAVLINYVQSVVYHEYISLSNKQKEWAKNAILTENIDSILSKKQKDNLYGDDFSQNLLFYDLSKYLTPVENNVITMLYWLGYTVRDICEIEHISRQAVNCTKRRALKKIKQHYFY